MGKTCPQRQEAGQQKSNCHFEVGREIIEGCVLFYFASTILGELSWLKASASSLPLSAQSAGLTRTSAPMVYPVTPPRKIVATRRAGLN